MPIESFPKARLEAGLENDFIEILLIMIIDNYFVAVNIFQTLCEVFDVCPTIW